MAAGSRFSLLERPPGPGFALRLVRIAPDEPMPYRPGEWAEALVVVEAGTIELETTAGCRIRFSAGAVLHLTGLPLAVIRSACGQAAILSAVSRGPPVHSKERTMCKRVAGPTSYFPSIGTLEVKEIQVGPQQQMVPGSMKAPQLVVADAAAARDQLAARGVGVSELMVFAEADGATLFGFGTPTGTHGPYSRAGPAGTCLDPQRPLCSTARGSSRARA